MTGTGVTAFECTISVEDVAGAIRPWEPRVKTVEDVNRTVLKALNRLGVRELGGAHRAVFGVHGAPAARAARRRRT